MSKWDKLKNIRLLGDYELTDFDFDIYQAICRAAKFDVEDITVKDLKAIAKGKYNADTMLSRNWVSFERLRELAIGNAPYNAYLKKRMLESISEMMSITVVNRSQAATGTLLYVSICQIDDRAYCGILEWQKDWGEVIV